MHTGQRAGKNLALPEGKSGHCPQFLESNGESLGISRVTAASIIHGGPLRPQLTASGGKVLETEFNHMGSQVPIKTGHRSSGKPPGLATLDVYYCTLMLRTKHPEEDKGTPLESILCVSSFG